MTEFVKVAARNEIPPGEGRCLQVGSEKIALFNVGGTLHAIDNTCCHMGGSLGEGQLDEKVVTCPLHGWQYDVTTGECQTQPGARVASFEVKVEIDDVLVAR